MDSKTPLKPVRKNILNKPADFRYVNNLFASYKEISSEEMGVQLSKEKLLIRGIGNPETYSITLKSDQTLELVLSTRNFQSLQVFPEKISLSKKSRQETVTVYSENNCNADIDLMHIDQIKKEFTIIKVFCLGSEGIELRTAGSDDYYQLAHDTSVSRFLDQMETSLESAEVNCKTAKILRPAPEKVFKNFETLCLGPGKDECYIEYPYWVDIAAGDLHGLCCARDGRLYSWGNGIFGQLGLPLEEFVMVQDEILKPRLKKIWMQKMQKVMTLQKMPPNLKENLDKMITPHVAIAPRLVKVPFPKKVEAVACGLYHSLILSQGEPYSFGLGESGRLGQGDENSLITPALIKLQLRCIKIAAGYHNSFFLLEDRTVWSCGDSSQKSSGHESNMMVPCMIRFIKDVHHISSASSHTGVVTIQGKAILFGSNTDHKLGGPSPHIIEDINGEKIRGVYCGGRHTCAVTEKLDVYAWGYNTSGQLGLSSTMFHSMTDPVKIEYLSGRGVVNLSLGWEHSIAITVDGLLYCWGSNAKGQLAIGTLAKEFRRVGLPRLIDQLLGCPVTAICAGKSCSFFITAESHPEKNSNLFAHWKKTLLYEERHMQELANYRFSLLIRDLKREQLVKKVEKERNQEIVRSSSSPKAHIQQLKMPQEIKSLPESYYAFWNEENPNTEKYDNRTVVRFGNPVYYKQGRPHVVTVFKKPLKKKTEDHEINLRDIMAIASNQGAKVEPRILQGDDNPTRPAYYERIQAPAKFSHGPSLLYPNLFPPYDLVPNSMILIPK
jgi:alpha-tubulin suppressor-like RCC1 family protein